MQLVEITEPYTAGVTKNSEEEVVVGIDFGTTNSLIAISQESNAKVIRMSNGLELLPSNISIVDGKFIVGQRDVSYNSIRSVKRLLAKASDEIKNNATLFALSDIFCLKDKNPKIYCNNSKFTLPEIASEIFKYLKTNAEKTLQKTVAKAVISVPAYFDDSAKGQVLLSAKLAGLEVIRMIAEPTAAAYAYGLNNKKNGTYLVYDLGGGTFDVSIVRILTGIFKVIATGGDNMLGGDDIDMIAAKYLADIHDLRIDTNLIIQAKYIKEKLSYTSETSFNNKVFSALQYEELISPIINHTIKIAQNTLYDADIKELDGIILVGGSTRIPLIKQKLNSRFKTKIYDNLDPDKIVSFGAALQAENLSSKSGALLIDVVPLSLGLEMYGGIVEKLIMRNTPIPSLVTKEFTTHSDNQTGMKFHILQGEREIAKDCRSLARFEITDIPPMKAGRAKVEITFSLDVNGILSIIARQVETNKIYNLDLQPSYGLTEKEINDRLVMAFSNAKSDHQAKLLIETKEDGNNLINGLQKAISETPDILSKNDINLLNNGIISLQKVIKLDNRDKILFKINELNKLAKDFIQKHLDKGINLRIKGRHISEI